MNHLAKVELHLHLDGSLNIKWAYDRVIRKEILPSNTTFEEFYNILFSRNIAHSAESIKKFEILCDILQEYEDLYEASYDLVRRLSNNGLLYAEIRFASQQHCLGSLTQLDALQAVIDGANAAMKKYPIKVGIINCLMHKGDSAAFNDEANRETIKVTKQLLGKGAVGLDLAGFENNCEYNEYAYLLKIAKDEGIPFTMHAGEMGVASHILDALNMGTQRIGHGINAVNDPAILKEVVDRQIPLEVCVTSNIKVTMNYASHPIRQLLKAGAKVTINTDNMIFSRSDLLNELAQLRMLGVDDKTLLKCQYNAVEAAFTDEKTKEYLRNELDKIVIVD